MSAAPRKFEATEAARTAVPVSIGLFAPSGAGKTRSALRIATGMQEVTGGDIFGIDTESKRMLHYADKYRFKHVPFAAPFGSLDYLEAIKYCVSQGAKTIIIDSMSHEHEGPGGYLMSHADEIQRMAGDDWKKAERVKFSAWIKPAANRRQLINGMLQMDVNFVMCLRSKEKLKLERGKDPEPLGWMPIAGDEFLYELTTAALLLPGAKGVPTWFPEGVGERQMAKTADQFAPIYRKEGPLDEEVGRMLATWGAGGDLGAKPNKPSNPNAAETWANSMLAELHAMLAAPVAEEYDAWMERNGAALGKLTRNHPDMAAILNETIAQIREKI
jgi:ABC-type dipeptide/oligopeptide/nickel transport system ATPase subunit